MNDGLGVPRATQHFRLNRSPSTATLPYTTASLPLSLCQALAHATPAPKEPFHSKAERPCSGSEPNTRLSIEHSRAPPPPEPPLSTYRSPAKEAARASENLRAKPTKRRFYSCSVPASASLYSAADGWTANAELTCGPVPHGTRRSQPKSGHQGRQVERRVRFNHAPGASLTARATLTCAALNL